MDAELYGSRAALAMLSDETNRDRFDAAERDDDGVGREEVPGRARSSSHRSAAGNGGPSPRLDEAGNPIGLNGVAAGHQDRTTLQLGVEKRSGSLFGGSAGLRIVRRTTPRPA